MPLPRAVTTHHKTIGEKLSHLWRTVSCWVVTSAGQKVHFIADSPAGLNLRGHQVGPLVHPGGGEDNVGDVGELQRSEIVRTVSQSVSQSVHTSPTDN